MIEVGNKLLKNVLRKSGQNWEETPPENTRNLNNRTIQQFGVSPTYVNYNLLLGLPWLWSVNAHISIRESKITIGDPAVGETMKNTIGPEMVFCNQHTLLLYFKQAFPKAPEVQKPRKPLSKSLT